MNRVWPPEPNRPVLPEGQAPAEARTRTPEVVTPAGGRFVAWVGFVFGSVMSIAANVLYTWLPADEHPAGWTPPITAQIGAAVWPVGLLISVEILSRVQWPDRWTWKVAKYGGAGVVALGSAVISYGHLKGVLIAWEYGEMGASVGPLVLDGLMVVSGFALLAMGEQTGADRTTLTEPSRSDQTAGSDHPNHPGPDPVRATAEVVRTAGPDRIDHTDRPELEAGPDPDRTAGPDHPGSRPDLRASTETAGSDPLFDEVVRWAADRTEPVSERAIRTQFHVGPPRAKLLKNHVDQRRTA